MAQNERRQLRLVIGQLEQATEHTVKRLVFEIVANLKEDTPVDIGWARANWLPSVGAPVAAPVGTRNPADVARAESMAAVGLTQVASYRLGQGPLFVSNNVPYMAFLNEGSSKQAPAQFVEAAIERAVRTVGTGRVQVG